MSRTSRYLTSLGAVVFGGYIVYRFALSLGLFGLAAVSSAPAVAGSVSGTIVFEGRAPAMRPVPIEADPMCAKLHADAPLLMEWLVLGEGQTVANMLVQVVSGLPEGKTYPMPEEPAVFTQKDCRYGPHLFVVRAGQKIRILNPDGILHNIHALPEVNREFNKAMPKTKTAITHTFEKPEPVFRIKCDVHAWMGAFAAVLDHPFHAVTAADGKFTIDGLEPGDYEIEAWHERLGVQRVAITIEDGQDTLANFTFERPQKKQ